MAQTLKTYQVILGNTDTDIVPTVGSNKRIRISGIIVGNVNASTKYFNMYKLPVGESVGDQFIIGGKNKKLAGTSDINGAAEYYITVPFHLSTGEKLVGLGESAASITVFVTGIEEDV